MSRSDFQSNPSSVLNRRRLLQITACAGAAAALSGCERNSSEAMTGSTKPHGVFEASSLTGADWTFHQEGETERLPAVVPGSTYTDLLRNGKLPDPYYRENMDKVQWVAEKNWFYERTFHISDEMLTRKHLRLQCDGLDTLATVWVNGHHIGDADNMFRQWSFNIKPFVHRGTNTLRIKFNTLEPTVRKLSASYKARYGINLTDPRCWIRKAPYMWGWDWCRPMLTQGIWRDIRIEAFDAKITDVGVHQHHRPDGSVRLSVHTSTIGAPADSKLVVTVSLGGRTVATGIGRIQGGSSIVDLTITQPELWWPNGMGAHPLYRVTVELNHANVVLHSHSCRVGLRTAEVLPPKDGVAMHIKINGIPVFAKGADWIPADNLPTRVTPEILRYYMKTAADCHFNFIRLWGGGYYEQDELFDLCDELGIMLQFEFKFANDTYPVNDKTWMDNLHVELEQQIRRCRNHPSIVIWSGNNEIRRFKGYYHLFGDVIGGEVHRLVPGAFYEVGSGAAGSGDIHAWWVWHGKAPFNWFRSFNGFVTEFGIQSFPAPQTVDTYTDAADRESIHSPVMRYHERDGSGHGIGIIMHYTNMYFGRSPDNFDDTLLLTQLDQSYGIRFAVEHWRRDMPRSMAAAIWQFNDCWPAPTWAMIDYDRRWKTVQYQSRHFFAPIIVTGIPDRKNKTAPLYVTSDLQKDASGVLQWLVTDLDGNSLLSGHRDIHIPARTSFNAHTLDLTHEVAKLGENNILIWPIVIINGQIVAQNTLFFPRPLELKLPRPQISHTIRGAGRQYHITMTSDKPALWCFLRLKKARGQFSDNFFHLRPGPEMHIYLTLDEPLSPTDIADELSIGSVYDLAPDMRQA